MNKPTPALVSHRDQGRRGATTDMAVTGSSSTMECETVDERRRTRKMILSGGNSMFRFPSFRRKAQGGQKSGSEESRLPTMANIQQTRRHSINTAVPVAATTTNLARGVSSSNHINPNPNQAPQEVPLRRDIQAGCLEAAIPIEVVSSPRGLSSWPRRTTRRTNSLYPDVTSSLLFLEQGRQASFDPRSCTVPLVAATPVFSCTAHHGDSFCSAMKKQSRRLCCDCGGCGDRRGHPQYQHQRKTHCDDR
jgi:hypothetical protein